MTTPLILAALAVLFAGPVPAALARLDGVRRTPLAAMLLWQSVAAAAVLAALGAGVSLITQHVWTEEPTAWEWGITAVAGGVTLLVLARLLLSAHRVGTSLRTLRREHRRQLDLVSTGTGRVRIIEHDLPVAYCVPGFGHPRIVLSQGAQGVLDEKELDAVVRHELAHLRARHDLVLEAFSALREAFPRWVSSKAALREVRLLVEVLADRAAVRANGAQPLARALVALAEARAPQAALGAGGSGLLVRVELLAEARPRRVQATVLLVAAAAVLAVPTAFVVVPWWLALV